MPLSDEAIRKLLDEATPGPWSTNVADFGMSNTGGPYIGVYDETDMTLAHVLCSDKVGSGNRLPFEANARLIAAAPDLAQIALDRGDEITRLREERARLALAIRGGEDAPGYANAQTVETLEAVAKANRDRDAEAINALLKAEAQVEKLREALRGMVRHFQVWHLDPETLEATLAEPSRQPIVIQNAYAALGDADA